MSKLASVLLFGLAAASPFYPNISSEAGAQGPDEVQVANATNSTSSTTIQFSKYFTNFFAVQPSSLLDHVAKAGVCGETSCNGTVSVKMEKGHVAGENIDAHVEGKFSNSKERDYFFDAARLVLSSGAENKTKCQSLQRRSGQKEDDCFYWVLQTPFIRIDRSPSDGRQGSYFDLFVQGFRTNGDKWRPVLSAAQAATDQFRAIGDGYLGRINFTVGFDGEDKQYKKQEQEMYGGSDSAGEGLDPGAGSQGDQPLIIPDMPDDSAGGTPVSSLIGGQDQDTGTPDRDEIDPEDARTGGTEAYELNRPVASTKSDQDDKEVGQVPDTQGDDMDDVENRGNETTEDESTAATENVDRGNGEADLSIDDEPDIPFRVAAGDA